jgi:hypothetical protein
MSRRAAGPKESKRAEKAKRAFVRVACMRLVGSRERECEDRCCPWWLLFTNLLRVRHIDSQPGYPEHPCGNVYQCRGGSAVTRCLGWMSARLLVTGYFASRPPISCIGPIPAACLPEQDWGLHAMCCVGDLLLLSAPTITALLPGCNLCDGASPGPSST